MSLKLVGWETMPSDKRKGLRGGGGGEPLKVLLHGRLGMQGRKYVTAGRDLDGSWSDARINPRLTPGYLLQRR